MINNINLPSKNFSSRSSESRIAIETYYIIPLKTVSLHACKGKPAQHNIQISYYSLEFLL
jgi:hypothetical protein